MHAPKWFKGQVDLEVRDLVYYQRTGNELASKYGRWTVGEIDELERSSDNCLFKSLMYIMISDNQQRRGS